MASEFSVTDQSISELAGVKILGDDTKEEAKHEPEDVSVADEINKEEEHKQVSSSSELAVETNNGKSDDVFVIFTFKEPLNSAFKREDLEAAEVAQTSDEIKSESSNKVEIELVEPENLKDDVHELNTEVPAVVFPNISEVPEEIDVDGTLTSISAPVKNLEAESGSLEEHKPVESAETKPVVELIKSEYTKGEVRELVPTEISSVDSEAPEENNADLITPTALEVPLKDPENYVVCLEKKRPEECGETKEHVESSMSEDSKGEVHEFVPIKVSINADAAEISDVDLSTRAIVEVPVNDFEVESSSPEEQKAEVGAKSEVKELIRSGYSKEGQDLVSDEVPTDISEAVKRNVHLFVPTSVEVPLKDLEVESGSPEEQKLGETVETKFDIELIGSGESKDGQDFVSGEVHTFEAPKEKYVDLSAPTSIVVPVKNLEIESSSPGEQKAEVGAETKVNIELTEPGDSKVEGQELVSAEVPASTSEVPKINDVELSTTTSTKVPVNDLQTESGSSEERKPEEGPGTKVNIDLIESGVSKNEGWKPVSFEVRSNNSEFENNDVNSSTCTSIEVPVKDLEVESGSPTEQKLEESANTEVNDEFIKSGESKEEGQDLFSSEVSSNRSEAPKINDVEFSTTSTEVHVEDLEVDTSSIEEHKLEESAVTKAVVDLIKSGDSKDAQESVSSKVFINTFEEPEDNNVDSSSSISIEVPAKDLEVESGSPEEQKAEVGAETKVNIKLTESGDSEVEGRESVPARTLEEPEDTNTELNTPTGIEVPVKDLEVESGSPEEQKIEESAESKVNTDFIKSPESKDEGQASVEVPTSSSQAPEINDVLSIPTSTEGPVEDLEVESGSPEEQKTEEGSETKVNIKLIESGDSKVEGQESVSAQVPASTFEEPEDTNTDLSTPTGIEVPVKDLEVESGSPEEKKFEGSAEIKGNADIIKSGELKDDSQDLVSSEILTNTSEAPGIHAVDSIAPTSTEVPVNDLEVESGSPEERKSEEGAETKVNINLIESGDSKVEGQESVSAQVPASTFEEPEGTNTDLSTPTGIEVPVNDLEVESGSPEEKKFEGSAEIKGNADFIKSGESKDDSQDLVSDEIPTNTSEAPGINAVNSSASTSTEVPVKDLEVESGSPEEEKSEEGAETIVNINLIESGDSKVEGQESVSSQVPARTFEEPEDTNTDLSTPTCIEVSVKDLEVESGSPEETKFEGSAEIKGNADFIKSGESKDDSQDLVSDEIPTNTSEAPGINAVNSSAPTSSEVPMKDLEVESGSPEEQKSEEGAETKGNIKLNESGDSKVEDQESVSAQVPASTFEVPEDLSTPTGIEVPAKDLEVESGSPEENKFEGSAEVKGNTEFIKSGESKDDSQDLVSDKIPSKTSEAPEIHAVDSSAPTSTEVPVEDLEFESGSPDEQKPAVNTYNAPEKEDVELSIPTSTEVPLKDLEVPSGSPEEQKLEESAKTNVDIESIKLGDEGQESVLTGFPTDTSEEHENNNVDLTFRTRTEVPVKDLEVESGSAEEQNPKESVETKEPSSDVIDGGGEVTGSYSYSYEDKSSGVGEVADEDESFKEKVIQTRIEQDQTPPDEDKVSEAVAVKKGDEIVDDGREGSTVFDIVLPVTEIFPGKVVEERKDDTFEVDNTDTAPKVSDVSFAGGNALEQDVLVEAIERNLGETSIDSTAAGVSTWQAKIPKNAEVEPLELKFGELFISPEASEVPSVGEIVSATEEKSESTKGGETKDETFEADNTDSTPNVSEVSSVVVNVLEKDVIERDLAETAIASTVETEASVEQFPEAVKEIIASESYEKKDGTSRDVSLKEKNANVNQDKKSEVKVEEVIENAPAPEELGIEKREGEKPKEEELIVSSDTRDVKLIKEVTKRDSNIFAKMKRSIIKAKKAILGKSPGPKTISSESKDENI